MDARAECMAPGVPDHPALTMGQTLSRLPYLKDLKTQWDDADDIKAAILSFPLGQANMERLVMLIEYHIEFQPDYRELYERIRRLFPNLKKLGIGT